MQNVHNKILETKKVPNREKWLFKNKEALKGLKKGLKDATEGRIYEKIFFHNSDANKIKK